MRNIYRKRVRERETGKERKEREGIELINKNKFLSYTLTEDSENRIDCNLRSVPQSCENTISAARLAVVFRRIPCVARIVLHEWYSIISHRTLYEFTYFASTSGPSDRSPLGSRFTAIFRRFFAIFALFHTFINFLENWKKSTEISIVNLFGDTSTFRNFCGFASNLSLWAHTYEFLQIIFRFYANSSRLNRQLYANLCFKLPINLVQIFC